MTPRENLLSLYRRSGYEFMPVTLPMSPAAAKKMRDALGPDTDPGEYYGYPEGFALAVAPAAGLRSEQDVDWRQFYDRELRPETGFDPYGVAREGGFEGAHHLNLMHHPMANFDSLDQMKAYPWPEWDFDAVDPVKEAVEEAHAEGLPILGAMGCTVWEKAWYIRDMTALMMDMTMEDEKATYLLDRITADAVGRARLFGKAGVDILHVGDDIGMQNSIMMSVDMYCQWLKPRLAEVLAAAREEKPDIIIRYHSCGYVEPFIPHLIEAGVDVLNPVQPECMDFAKLHAEYGDVLSFDGTIGTQTTMPFGTPDDVRGAVKRNLDIAGPRGGLTAAPTHVLEPEVPWENIEAYITACREYRP